MLPRALFLLLLAPGGEVAASKAVHFGVIDSAQLSPAQVMEVREVVAQELRSRWYEPQDISPVTAILFPSKILNSHFKRPVPGARGLAEGAGAGLA